eukprot:1256356-Prymnesium_polylepis.1
MKAEMRKLIQSNAKAKSKLEKMIRQLASTPSLPPDKQARLQAMREAYEAIQREDGREMPRDAQADGGFITLGELSQLKQQGPPLLDAVERRRTERLALQLPPAGEQWTWTVVHSSRVAVRERPSTGAKAVRTAAPGELVYGRSDATGSWVELSAGGW